MFINLRKILRKKLNTDLLNKNVFELKAVPSKGTQWPVDTIKRFQSLILNAKLSVMIFPEKDWPIYFCTIKIIGSKNDNVNM
jgi:hypothetical protein